MDIECLGEAIRDDTPVATNWQKFAIIVQAEFRSRNMAEEKTWQTVVLISKGGRGDFWGIGLIEVLWKAATSLLNQRLTAAITFHDVLHGFWEGGGTGTAGIEANLLQHLTAIREALLFEVLLDLQRAYGNLDRYRCLKIIGA